MLGVQKTDDPRDAPATQAGVWQPREATSRNRPRVFISSTVLDLPQHRSAAVDACVRVGAEPIVMEAFAAGESDPLGLSGAALDQADIYLGILAFRYGFVPPGQEKSLTEIEYERAATKGIPRLVFVMSEDHPVRPTDVETGLGAEKLQSFKALVRQSAIVAEFRSPEQLKAEVVTALVEVLRDKSRHPERPTALLLLPFGEAHDPLREFVSQALMHEGVQVFRLDKIEPGTIWVNEITDAIRRADFVVVDITNANPNVMYELGYVHALRKPTIMLAESEAIRSLPSDLLGFQLLAYDKHDLEALKRPLARFLREYAREGHR